MTTTISKTYSEIHTTPHPTTMIAKRPTALHRRPRHGFGDTRTRFWCRYQGRIIRLLNVTDYRPCESGNPPREFFKRITHRRWRRGQHLMRGDYPDSFAQWHAELPADQWVEVI